MRAAIIEAHGGPEEIRLVTDFPDPQPAPGDVAIREDATSLNYHEIFSRNGMPGITVQMPMIMGIDIVGPVLALGEGVEGVGSGERVLVDPITRRVRGGLIGEMRHGRWE